MLLLTKTALVANTISQRWWAYLPFLAWALLIASLSTTSNLPQMPLQWLSPDKIGHLLFYAILTGWWYWGGQRWWNTAILSWRYVLTGTTLAFLYGAILEGIQARLPNRQFDYADMLANGVGACCALAVWWWLERHLHQGIPK